MSIFSDRIGKPVARLLPEQLSNLIHMLPDQLPPASPLPEITPAIGPRRARVALLAGCAQQVLAPEINIAALQVLSQHGVEVHVPAGQVCCGALAAHTGAADQAASLARKNLELLPADYDAVITTAAGCGSGLHEYPLWLRGDPMEAMATELATRAVDVSQFLYELGLVRPARLPQPTKVVYQDACHLKHGQGVGTAPRRILAQIENLELLAAAQPDTCCGSAGTYNLEQPAIANELGAAKVTDLTETGADLIVSGNIGCIMQLRTHLLRAKRDTPVIHTVELLARAEEASPAVDATD